MKKIILGALSFLFILSAYSRETFKDQFSFSLGMVSIGLTQNASAFAESKAISSGTVSNISLDLNYEHFSSSRNSHGIKIIGSGFAGEVTKYYAFGYTHRYYFGGEGTISKIKDDSLSLYVRPIFRYYAGFSVNGVSAIYETSTEVRSDLLLEIGGNAGLLYGRNSNNSYKFELSALRSTGVETSGFGFQVFFGTSYFVDSIF